MVASSNRVQAKRRPREHEISGLQSLPETTEITFKPLEGLRGTGHGPQSSSLHVHAVDGNGQGTGVCPIFERDRLEMLRDDRAGVDAVIGDEFGKRLPRGPEYELVQLDDGKSRRDPRAASTMLVGGAAPYWLLAITLAICNLGLGFSGPAMMSSVMHEAGKDHANIGSATLSANRQIGALCSVALMGLLLDTIPDWGLSLRVVFSVFALCMVTAAVLVQQGMTAAEPVIDEITGS
jgi:hypothetical protein